MIRAIAAIFVGLATAMFVVTVLGQLKLSMYPLPEGTDMKDVAAMGVYLAEAPVGYHLLSLFAYCLAALLGGLGACSMAKENPPFFSFVVGGAVLMYVSKALREVDYPVWFNAASVIGIVSAIALSVVLANRLGFNNPSQSPLASE
ncbi:MAG: hypothetical protein P1V35_02925 [Planctomycetota bacterium]|nr:hypothetical protein [Planctomycetota bacterium]